MELVRSRRGLDEDAFGLVEKTDFFSLIKPIQPSSTFGL
jgi:hypothetical protein